METRRSLTVKATATLSITFLALMFLALPAHAASACTRTVCNLQGATLDFGPLGPNPCNGVAGVGDLLLTGNLQSHVSADGTHGTFTFTGSGTITEADGVTGSIQATLWDGGSVNSNNQQAVFKATFDATIRGSDGSLVGLHSVGQMTTTAGGTVTASFNFNTLICE